MGDRLISSLATIATGIIGLAVVAVLVSRNANTSGVIGAGGSAFSGALQAAEGPVLGNSLGVGGTYLNNEL
jgi:ABC-type sugar transport system substrate-binding protein